MTQTNRPSGRTGDDAPEWIFATGDGVNGSWTTREVPEVWGAAVTKYVRADLEATASPSIATLPDPLADPRVKALVNAAKHCRELLQANDIDRIDGVELADAAIAIIDAALNQYRAALETRLAEVEAERDEADRRAGAAERAMVELKDSKQLRNQWLDNAKQERGYHRSVSFDVVWKETCDKADQADSLSALLATARRDAWKEAASLNGWWLVMSPHGEPDGTYCSVQPSDEPSAVKYVSTAAIRALIAQEENNL